MTFDKVKEIMVNELNLDEGEIQLESNLKEDLDIDSLDATELIMAVEEEFDLEFPEDVVANMKTVKDIVDYLDNNQ